MKSEKIDKRKNILEAAEALFSEVGFDATTTRQIAKDSGANMAMINYYFGSKEGVFMEIMSHYISGFKTQLDQIKESKESSNDKILLVIKTYVGRVLRNVRFHKMMQREYSLCQRPIIFDSIKDAMRKNLLTIESIIEEGIKNGSFRNVDIRLCISTIMGTISYTALSASKILGKPINFEDKSEIEMIEDRLNNHFKELISAYLLK